ncbi:phage tail tube protein [Agrobacterium sp.]|uniref:phage tail tube protein n=1 Tax=Agrobacterium sp. TaxID=361 RepID=UPI0025C375E1|nr:phage tail tube protein [Agrobacterium sp.]MCD4663130.1 hypothetical protein [Agrobacterium sp.]
MSLNAPRYFDKLACLTKIETDYGQDAGPVPADRIIMSNVTFRPLVAQRLSRDLLLPFHGNQGVILTDMYATIEGDIELAGSGTPGTPPLWGSMARICAMRELVTEDTDVRYKRADDPLESASIYFIMDRVRHILLGARGTCTLTWSSSAIPRGRFSISGLLGTITDLVSNPVVSRAGWITPVPVSKANTSMTLHGWDAVAQTLSFNIGNTVTPQFLIGDEAILISAGSATGNTVVQAKKLADIDWFSIAKNRTRGELEFQHGKQAGNIIELTATGIEVGEPEPGSWNGILNYSMALDYCVTDGFDDFELICR